MTLEETVPLMLSLNWKDRFIAEYWQTKIRLKRLYDYAKGAERENVLVDRYSFIVQGNAMEAYLGVLKNRARVAGIKLGDENEREDKQ